VRCAEKASSIIPTRQGPTSPAGFSVGNDLKVEVAKLAWLLSHLVLYASIYMLLRLAISLAVMQSRSDAERDLVRFSPSATKSWSCAGR
jgi:hypothetical protein